MLVIDEAKAAHELQAVAQILAADDLLVQVEGLLRECAQRFGNAVQGKLSEKTAAEMSRKCGQLLRKVEDANAST